MGYSAGLIPLTLVTSMQCTRPNKSYKNGQCPDYPPTYCTELRDNGLFTLNGSESVWYTLLMKRGSFYKKMWYIANESLKNTLIVTHDMTPRLHVCLHWTSLTCLQYHSKEWLKDIWIHQVSGSKMSCNVKLVLSVDAPLTQKVRCKRALLHWALSKRCCFTMALHQCEGVLNPSFLPVFGWWAKH